MKNVQLETAEGQRVNAVHLGTHEDGTAELTYQAGGRIQTVRAELKKGAKGDVYVAREENS